MTWKCLITLDINFKLRLIIIYQIRAELTTVFARYMFTSRRQNFSKEICPSVITTIPVLEVKRQGCLRPTSNLDTRGGLMTGRASTDKTIAMSLADLFEWIRLMEELYRAVLRRSSYIGSHGLPPTKSQKNQRRSQRETSYKMACKWKRKR